MKRRVQTFLNLAIFPDDLELGVVYDRQHDDTDGGTSGHLQVQFSCNGDAWLAIDGHTPLRFRSYFGGPQSPKVYAALVILAEAIRQDNIDNPMHGRSEQVGT